MHPVTGSEVGVRYFFQNETGGGVEGERVSVRCDFDAASPARSSNCNGIDDQIAGDTTAPLSATRVRCARIGASSKMSASGFARRVGRSCSLESEDERNKSAINGWRATDGCIHEFAGVGALRVELLITARGNSTRHPAKLQMTSQRRDLIDHRSAAPLQETHSGRPEVADGEQLSAGARVSRPSIMAVLRGRVKPLTQAAHVGVN